MHLLYAVLVIMYLGAPVLGVPPVIPYNCKVQVPECQNSGVCDIVTKTCDCTGTGFGGVDCSIPDAPSACADPTICLNGGTCDNEICYCTGDYTGADCGTAVLSAVCGATSMTVTFTPGYTFTGHFYVNGFAATCTAEPVTGEQMVPYTGGPCDDPYTVATYTDPAGDYYKVPFKIQYNAIAESDNDLIIEVYCEDSPSTPFSAEFNVLDVDPDTDATLTVLTGTFIKTAGMSMEVQREDGTALANGDTVNVGDVVKVIFILDVGAYTQTKWGTLVVGDAAVPTNTLTVLTAGCVDPDGQEIIEGVETDVLDPTTLKTLTTKISVVKFLDSTELNIAMTGTGCDDVDDSCNLAACDPAIYTFLNVLPNEFGTKGLRRRRRRAAGDESGGQSLSGSINITLNVKSLREDLNAIKNKLDKDGTATSCMRSIVFLIPMILLALMLLISMAMTLYFCLKVTRRRDKDDREFGPAVNMGYKA